MQIKVCPECKAPIKRALRYRKIIKRAPSGVDEAKKQITSDWVVIRAKQERLRQDIIDEELKITGKEGCSKQSLLGQNRKDFVNVAKTFLADVFQQVNCSASKASLKSLEYKVDMYKQLWEHWRNAENVSSEKGIDERKLLLESVFIDVLLWLKKVPCTSEQNDKEWDFGAEANNLNERKQLRRIFRCGNIIEQAPSGIVEAKKQIITNWVFIRAKQEQLRQDIIDEELKITGEEGGGKQSMLGQNRKDFANVAKTFLADAFQQVNCSASKARLTSLEYKMDIYKQLWEYGRNTKNISSEKNIDERKLLLECVFIDVLLWLNKVPCSSKQIAKDGVFGIETSNLNERKQLRFVELEDCGHIAEVKSLDTWMKQPCEDDSDVLEPQIKVYPECKDPMRGALRYCNINKRALFGVEEAKKQITSDWVDIRAKQERLRQDVIDEELKIPGEEGFGKQSLLRQNRKGFANVAKTFLADIFQQVNCSASKAPLKSLEYKVDMYKQLWEYWLNAENISSEKGNDERKLLLESVFIDVLLWLNKVPCTSEQNAEDWDFEVKRIYAIIKVMEVIDRVSVTHTLPNAQSTNKIDRILSDGLRYSVSKQYHVVTLLQELFTDDTCRPLTEEDQ
ncbi:NFX1-type zinc finger-containing protein 1 [Holothuria leucospilota]|uniref:NFX1-type zinc finger-containing protein 1 n=1 Tax=Holothuria leucospilota TaxID=206669 RepID=A0A9Q1CCF8_HOLLE|nr:NFX1-type zinc finger-containing protein 1 [Holothuria leucospilota]